LTYRAENIRFLTYNLTVVWILGFIAVVALVGVIGLSYMNKEVPQALIAIGSVAVGALGSLFTHSK